MLETDGITPHETEKKVVKQTIAQRNVVETEPRPGAEFVMGALSQMDEAKQGGDPHPVRSGVVQATLGAAVDAVFPYVRPTIEVLDTVGKLLEPTTKKNLEEARHERMSAFEDYSKNSMPDFHDCIGISFAQGRYEHALDSQIAARLLQVPAELYRAGEKRVTDVVGRAMDGASRILPNYNEPPINLTSADPTRQLPSPPSSMLVTTPFLPPSTGPIFSPLRPPSTPWLLPNTPDLTHNIPLPYQPDPSSYRTLAQLQESERLLSQAKSKEEVKRILMGNNSRKRNRTHLEESTAEPLFKKQKLNMSEHTEIPSQLFLKSMPSTNTSSSQARITMALSPQGDPAIFTAAPIDSAAALLPVAVLGLAAADTLLAKYNYPYQQYIPPSQTELEQHAQKFYPSVANSASLAALLGDRDRLTHDLRNDARCLKRRDNALHHAAEGVSSLVTESARAGSEVLSWFGVKKSNKKIDLTIKGMDDAQIRQMNHQKELDVLDAKIAEFKR